MVETLIANLLTELKKDENKGKVETLMALGQFKTKEDLFAVFEDGSGPKLAGADLLRVETVKMEGGTLRKSLPGKDNSTKSGRLGQTTGTELVQIDDGVLSLLEKTFDSKSGLDADATKGILLLVESTVLHEVAHVGDNKDGVKNNAAGAGDEVGKSFEIKVYGKDVDYGNLGEIIKKWFMENRKPDEKK